MWAGKKFLSGVIIWSFVVALPGCSFLFTTAPKHAEPPPAEYVPSECTSSKAAPVVDTVIAGLEGIRTGYALSADQSAYEKAPISRGADIAFGLGFLALFTASAIYGYSITGQCARSQHGVRAERAKEPEESEAVEPNDSPPRRREAPPSDLAP
ncbi:MAG TPA: hypothetical protein VER11_25455 [Polyangiaceae bacterium]|nr:hypothetical protein [Polyangiaceae bacterium]